MYNLRKYLSNIWQSVANTFVFNQEGKFFITTKNKFNNLIELIEYYKKNSAGLICNLKNPVKRNVLDKASFFDKSSQNETSSSNSKVSLENLDSIYSSYPFFYFDFESCKLLNNFFWRKIYNWKKGYWVFWKNWFRSIRSIIYF